MIWLFGERVDRRQGKNVVPAFVPADQEASGAQGSNYTRFFFICTSPYPVFASKTAVGSLAFNWKAPFLSLGQGTMGTGPLEV